MTRVSEEYQTEGDDFTRLQSEETSRKPDELDEVRFKTTVEKKKQIWTHCGAVCLYWQGGLY